MNRPGRDIAGPTPSRIFATFRRWPLVPAGELYRLRAALSQCVELAGTDTAHELLALVSAELESRENPEHPDPRFSPGRAPARDRAGS